MERTTAPWHTTLTPEQFETAWSVVRDFMLGLLGGDDASDFSFDDVYRAVSRVALTSREQVAQFVDRLVEFVRSELRREITADEEARLREVFMYFERKHRVALASWLAFVSRNGDKG